MDDGIVKFYSLSNAAPAGSMPKYSLTYKCSEFFANRTVGYNRSYVAKGAGESVDRLIRCWENKNVRVGMYAVFEDSEQFRITFVQHLEDENGLDVMDITLSKEEDLYAISE